MRDYIRVCFYTFCWWTVIVSTGYLAFQCARDILRMHRRTR